MSNIRLSKKHGVNPSVTRCFWCEKDIGVALFGRLPTERAEKMFGKEFVKDASDGEVEAPRTVMMGINPCGEDCEVWANSKKGVFFVECAGDEHDPKPTGRFVCITDDAVMRLLDDTETRRDALKQRVCYIHTADYREIFRDA